MGISIHTRMSHWALERAIGATMAVLVLHGSAGDSQACLFHLKHHRKTACYQYQCQYVVAPPTTTGNGITQQQADEAKYGADIRKPENVPSVPAVPPLPDGGSASMGQPDKENWSVSRDGTNSGRWASLVVKAPQGARISAGGVIGYQSNGNSTFVSPPLLEGQNYIIEVKVEMIFGGRAVAESRTINIHSGGAYRVVVRDRTVAKADSNSKR